MGSAHGLDIAFVTGNFKFGPLGWFVYPKGKSRDQMQDTMMNAWTSFAKTGIPNTGKDVKWEKFNSKDRIFIKLDSDEFLSLDKEMLSMKYILGSLKLSPVGSLLEKCMLARETLDNIGDPLLDELGRWNEGVCNQFDLNKERKKIEDDLIQEYGSVSVYGQFE
jgi:para-nitrobenzyl esterase